MAWISAASGPLPSVPAKLCSVVSVPDIVILKTVPQPSSQAPPRASDILFKTHSRLEWRNWQTHGTQNPATFTGHEGSTPSSSTM